MEDDDDQNQESHCLQTLTLDLFDLYWFRSLVLLNHPVPSPPPTPLSPPPPAEADSSTSSPRHPPPPEILLRRRTGHHRRSLSDDFSPSPTLQIHPPKLQTILSGKESAISDEIPRLDRSRMARGYRRRRRHESSSKSLSELEFEELKGFMDLGFTFSDVESDPRLMEIVPALHRLKAEEVHDVAAAEVDDVASSRRPYLSEAWEDEEEEVNIPVRRFEIPIEGEGVDLKDRLRFWAQAVASTVR